MEGERRPVSLGDRLHVVALVCGVATLLVLAGGLVVALRSDLSTGAAPTALQQRLLLVSRPAELELALVILVGAAAVTVGRWLDGDDPAAGATVAKVVAGAAAAVVVLAVIGMYGEVFWRFDGADWSWHVGSVTDHTATAALASVACWLALPRR